MLFRCTQMHEMLLTCVGYLFVSFVFVCLKQATEERFSLRAHKCRHTEKEHGNHHTHTHTGTGCWIWSQRTFFLGKSSKKKREKNCRSKQPSAIAAARHKNRRLFNEQTEWNRKCSFFSERVCVRACVCEFTWLVFFFHAFVRLDCPDSDEYVCYLCMIFLFHSIHFKCIVSFFRERKKQSIDALQRREKKRVQTLRASHALSNVSRMEHALIPLYTFSYLFSHILIRKILIHLPETVLHSFHNLLPKKCSMCNRRTLDSI